MVAVSFRYWIIGHRPVADLALPARSVADKLIRLDTPQGQQLLFASQSRTAFLPLIAFFDTQRGQTYCGVASVAMVLNALELPAPAADKHGTHRLFTQENILNGRTDHLISERTIARRGMLLADVARVLEAYGAKVDLHQAASSSVDTFREMAARYLNEPGHHVIVNYSRAALGQEIAETQVRSSGHISPLGAYDAESDRFLILDVSRYKVPAMWIAADHLFEAMAEPKSPGSSQSRGYLLIRKRQDPDGE
jgi:hypothetical protein